MLEEPPERVTTDVARPCDHFEKAVELGHELFRRIEILSRIVMRCPDTSRGVVQERLNGLGRDWSSIGPHQGRKRLESRIGSSIEGIEKPCAEVIRA